MATHSSFNSGNPTAGPAAADDLVARRLEALAADEAGLRLSPARRATLLREIRNLPAVARVRGFRPGFREWSMAWSRVPAYATLVTASLILGFAYLSSFTPVQIAPVQPARPHLSPSASISTPASGPTDLRVKQEGGNIVLEWNDGRQASYTVRQATSARAVYSAPGVQVRGHRYVDRSPSDATVVYYLVE